MCGIAGLIHRGSTSDIGEEMTKMLQSLKHRGPDSTEGLVVDPPRRFAPGALEAGYRVLTGKTRRGEGHSVGEIGAPVPTLNEDSGGGCDRIDQRSIGQGFLPPLRTSVRTGRREIP